MSSYPYKAVATLKYRPPPAQGPSISFDKGSYVTILGSADDDGDWLEGENEQGIKGVFPSTFVQRVEEEGEAKSSDEGRGGEGSTEKEEELDAPTEATQAKDEVPEPANIEQAAASVSNATSPPPQPTSPPTIPEPTPSAASTISTKSTPAKSTPPPPAKKPNALAARIAAFNQSQQTSPASAPVPRPKPASKWSVDTSSSATSSSPPPAPSANISSPPPSSAQPALQPETDSTGKPKEFSAEDAKESIGRGGGSLKDRIKALQGLQIDQPAPPGRPPKPWKKKSVEEEVPEQTENTPVAEDSEKNLEDTVVKDQEPKHDLEQAEESVPEIPSFAPAEATTEELEDSGAKEGKSKEVVEDSRDAKEEKMVESNQEAASAVPSRMSEPPSGKPSSIDLLAIAADSTPVVMTPGSASLEAPTDPSPFIPATDKPPVAPQNEEQTVEGEEDSEAAKKEAIVQRMAGLRGQKMGGVPIPALPKKAAGPRRTPRGGAKPATPASAPEKEEEEPKVVEPQEVEIEQTRVRESQEQPLETADDKAPLEQLGSKDVEAETIHPDVKDEGKKEDILASMGGASTLLRDDDDEEHENSKRGFDDDDDFDTPAPPPPSRPAVPPPAPPVEGSFEDPKLDAGEQQVGAEEFAQRDDSLGEQATLGEEAVETLPTPATADPIVDEASSQDHEAEDSAAPARVPLNRPPVPPSFVRKVTDVDNTESRRPHGSDEVAPTPPDSQPHSPQAVPADLAGFEIPEAGQRQKLPIPRHPAPPQHEKVTTDAEDRIMNETEVVTPPQEAFDESTAAPELDAPSVLDLAAVRDSQPESTELAESALPTQHRKEGELSPPPVTSPVQSPRPSSPQAQTAEESEEDDEEEDPEVARRRSIAARMAKLGGGRGMMMGMMPTGGIAPKPKKAKKPKTEDEELTRNLEAKDLSEQVVESQSSGNVTPDHPARRYGGMPVGGFALPGIAALRPVQDAPVEESPKTEVAEESQPEEEVETPTAEVPEEVESEPTPPPLPAGRPLSMPPRRSVPVPEPESTEANEDADEENNSEQTEEFVAEPEHQEEMAPPPPPPARPVGGHQNSLPPTSPPLPPSSAVPSSPPSRPIPTPSKRDSTFSLGRSTTRSSHRSSTIPPNAASMGFASPRQSLDLAFDSERVQGGGAPQGSYLARDVDLDVQAGKAWWRAPNGLPRALQGRNDVTFDLLSETPGNSRHEKELQVLYQDYSRTIISIAFDPSDSTETSTSLSQNHFPPPGKSTLDVLLRYSSSIGAQIFAAAHLKSTDRSARGMTDAQFVDFCFSRATDPVPRIGSVCGAVVYEASSGGKKGAAYALEDEPKAGDVVSFRDVKLRATLGSKTVGSHLAIVSGFEDKKAKLRVLEVDKNGAIEEGSYKLDDLKQGTITVYRVMGKDFLL